ncbi:MAG: F0F1 ATP synthase subunit gamma [Planctomycetes bacterium]|nr:F0F1 ATP synthase subunit gamma [Planctomycetota bacterium]
MSDTTANLRRHIKTASDLQAVVRTMKAIAASHIGQYEKCVRALADYYRTVELGLGSLFRDLPPTPGEGAQDAAAQDGRFGAIVFGSDQGLVGQFNQVVTDHAIATLAALHGKAVFWAVGERVQARLADAGVAVIGVFAVPNAVEGITSLVGRLQIASEAKRAEGGYDQLYVFHNRPKTGSLYEPVALRLLPLDRQWQDGLAKVAWPTKLRPEVMGSDPATLRAYVREYLFISLYRACAESLASENASRLAAMERADRNIKESLEDLRQSFNRLRQSSIDEELFDVISGYESLTTAQKTHRQQPVRGAALRRPQEAQPGAAWAKDPGNAARALPDHAVTQKVKP